MAWRIDPLKDEIDWTMDVSAKYRQTASTNDTSIDKKFAEYVMGILESWAENGISDSLEKAVPTQVCDIAMHAGILIGKDLPSNRIKDHLDRVESFYEKKIQPLKMKIQDEPELLSALETIEGRVEMYAEKFGRILKNEDEIETIIVEHSGKMLGEIFELELPVALQNIPAPLAMVRLSSNESIDFSEGITDIDSANVSELTSPCRAESRDRSSSSDSISSGFFEVPSGPSKKLSPLFKSITVVGEVFEKKERARRIDVSKNITSQLTEQINNPPQTTFPIIEPRSQRFLRESAKNNPQAGSSAPAVLISPEEFLEVPEKLREVQIEEEWIPVEWLEEDNLLPIELDT